MRKVLAEKDNKTNEEIKVSYTCYGLIRKLAQEALEQLKTQSLDLFGAAYKKMAEKNSGGQQTQVKSSELQNFQL